MQGSKKIGSVMVSGPEYSRLCRVDGVMKAVRDYLVPKYGQSVSASDILMLIPDDEEEED